VTSIHTLGVRPVAAAAATGGHDDLAAVARAILDANLYMTLGTADEDGRPWVTPVFYATADYTDFYWISRPDARHSRNIARRTQVSAVVFDSTVPAYTGQAVYMSAVATEVVGDDLDLGLAVYPGAAERGAGTITAQQVSHPAAYRLYRATVSEHFVICPRDAGLPCDRHGIAADHRTNVSP
jgi:Pyridoxamine 5'-phosphate oxidase